MNSAAAPDKATTRAASSEEECRQAIDYLDQALDSAPPEVVAKVRQAEHAVVRLRDRAIDELRSRPTSTEAKQVRTRLEQINVALSCIAGVEYPSGGIHHKLLKEAREVLKTLLGELPP